MEDSFWLMACKSIEMHVSMIDGVHIAMDDLADDMTDIVARKFAVMWAREDETTDTHLYLSVYYDGDDGPAITRYCESKGYAVAPERPSPSPREPTPAPQWLIDLAAKAKEEKQ